MILPFTHDEKVQMHKGEVPQNMVWNSSLPLLPFETHALGGVETSWLQGLECPLPKFSPSVILTSSHWKGVDIYPHFAHE